VQSKALSSSEREAKGEREVGSVGWVTKEMAGGDPKSDDRSNLTQGYEAMQLTCSYLSLCPIYHPRLCLFSESPPPAAAPTRFLIFSSSSSLFFLLLSLTLFFYSFYTLMTDEYSVSSPRSTAPTLQRGKACLRCRSVLPALPQDRRI